MSRALALALLLSACGTAVEMPPPPPRDGGSEPVDCGAALPLELGRCVGEDGIPCDGSELVTRWDPMPVDGALAPLVGPQGSVMFALAARARGVEPGDAERPASRDNPVVTLSLFGEEGEELARLGSRSPWSPSPDLADTFETAQLFVVVDDLAGRLDGRALRAEATLLDGAGTVACGSLGFVTPE